MNRRRRVLLLVVVAAILLLLFCFCFDVFFFFFLSLLLVRAYFSSQITSHYFHMALIVVGGSGVTVRLVAVIVDVDCGVDLAVGFVDVPSSCYGDEVSVVVGMRSRQIVGAQLLPFVC